MIMNIKYAEIVGTRMAEEGSGGYTVNSTSYSVLVFTTSGTVELVEGSATEIRHLVPYMRPHNDPERLESILSQFEDRLKKDIDQVIDAKIGKVIDTLYPLPEVKNKPYEEAKAILEKAGFVVELKKTTKASEDKSLVIQCTRKDKTMRTAVIHLGYAIPDVCGMSIDEATQTLQNAGFNVTVKNVLNQEYEDGAVIGAEYADDKDDDLVLYINDLSGFNPDSVEDTFLYEMQNKASMSEIYDLWDYYDLGRRYKNIDSYIKMRKESETKSGVPKNLDQIKGIIAQMIKQ